MTVVLSIELLTAYAALGTAGLTVAYRLAEDGTKSVAVIEAGGYYEQENGNVSVVPVYCVQYGATTPGSATMYPNVDWGFVTQPEPGLGGRRLHYGRGKMLGGRYVPLTIERLQKSSDACDPVQQKMP